MAQKEHRPPSTQDHLEILDVRDNVVILKNGSACSVLQTNAVNFDLLSESEQDALIFAYASLLNSLTFPIQIVIRSKRLDISSYLERLQVARESQNNPRLQRRIDSYTGFIKDLIAKNNVLDKRFYVIIPFAELKIGSLNPTQVLFGKKRLNFDKWQVLERAKTQLAPKQDQIIRALARLGIKTKVLGTQELVELFYDAYNSSTALEQRIGISAQEYTAPIVQPAIQGEEELR
jgi:type IV secretory pathway VirB4 component